jgi:hypothetical protein
MTYKYIATSVLLLFTVIAINAQRRRYIYVGDNMQTKFQSGNILRDPVDNSFINFLEYQTLRQLLLKDTENSKVEREGIILPAKSTITSSVNAQADFGNKYDSCSIIYKTTVQRIRNGRSAALSIINLFSGSSEKVRQPDPSNPLQSIQSEGAISHGGKDNHFLYTSAPRT